MLTPVFPINVVWLKTNELEKFYSVVELECNLEHFDSDYEFVKVTDALGRDINLVIDTLQVKNFSLRSL